MIIRKSSHGACFVLLGGAFLLLSSCSLDTPDRPVADNPWDPNNPNPPRAPSNLTGQVLSETSIALHWQDMSGNETGYCLSLMQVAHAEDSTGIEATDTLAANDTSIVLTDLRPASYNRFSVNAFNAAGGSSRSNGITLNTAEVLPTAPENTSLTPINGTSLRFQWQDRSANETNFEVFASIDTAHLQQYAVIPRDSTSCLIDSLEPFKRYYCRVRAVNSFGASSSTPVIAAEPGRVPLNAPYDLIAEAISESEISLSWSDSNLAEESFHVFESVADTLQFTIVATVDSPNLRYQIDNRTPNTTYFYRVVAQNRFCNSPASALVRASTNEVVPWPPSSLTSSISNELDVTLGWQDNSHNETGFELQESVRDTLHFATLDTLESNSVVVTLFDRIAFSTCYYRIRSFGAIGSSNWVYWYPIVPGSFSPIPPTDLTARADSPTEVTLNWHDITRIEESYELQQIGGVNHDWSAAGTMPQNTERCQVTGLEVNTIYSFRLRATNRYGSSEWIQSNVVMTPGPPAAPTNLHAEAWGNGEIAITWQNTEGQRIGFVVEDSLDRSDGFSTVDTILAPDTTQWVIHPLAAYIRNFLRLRAFNQYGNSSWSNSAVSMPSARIVYIACNDAGLVAVDINSIPPTEVRRLDTPGLAQRVAVEGDRAYVADSYGGVEVFDISSPALMTQIGSYDTPGRAYAIAVKSQVACVADGDSGVVILDFNNVASPTLLSRLPIRPGLAKCLYWQDNNILVACQARGALQIDASNRRQPYIRHESASPSSSEGIYPLSDGQHAIVAEYAAGIRILNTPEMSEVGTLSFNGFAVDVAVLGTTAYIANFSQGITVVNISDPTHPQYLTTIHMPDDVWSLSLFASDWLIASIDDSGIKVLNVWQQPENPQEGLSFQTPGPARGAAMVEYK